MQNTGQSFLKDAKLQIKPNEDEIEISVFGRGYGECIVLCTGNQDFVVVDSFINPQTNNPISIDYLQAMNIDCSAIKYVILTHWHADHIAGISKVLYAANSNVKLVLSPIITDEKFNSFISQGIQEGLNSTSEFSRVLNYIKKRGKECIILTTQDQRVCANEDINDVEIFTLAPQQLDLVRYLQTLILSAKGHKTAYEFHDDNILSIVLLMKFMNDGILLGGDLENVTARTEGWNAVVNNYSHKKCRPSIFKVPHHGSENGHNDLVWKNILREKPVSILTVYNKGSKLPKESDVNRIKKLSQKLFVVGNKAKLNKDLRTSMRKLMPNITIEEISNEIGMVRLRRSLKNPENEYIDIFGAAKEV